MPKPATAALFALALALAGCGDGTTPNADYPAGQPPVDEQARLGEPEVDNGTPTDEAEPPVPAEESHTADGLVYTVPAGWTVGEARQMRVLTLDAGGGVEVAVAKWPNGVGGLETNLTRWFGQAGYNPADAVAMQRVRAGFASFTLGDAQVTWAPLLDGEGGTPMIGVWAPRGENPTAQSETWTIKITGETAALRERQDALRAWAESLRFE